MSALDQASVRAAYLRACRAELTALKPGNVHRFAPGHDMTVDDFLRSAEVSAPQVCDPTLGVGEAVFRAVAATREAVGCNTNLGILLLCVPLARAAASAGRGSLRERLEAVLAGLDREDADFAFRAIRTAAPAGLGTSPRHDVHAPAVVTLRAAMAEARDRDRIAAQYVTGFAEVFDRGLPRLEAGLARGWSLDWALTGVYLDALAREPDSHVARKLGAGAAEALRAEIDPLAARFRAHAAPADFETGLLALDRSLKARGINPGISADLTDASLFAHLLSPASI